MSRRWKIHDFVFLRWSITQVTTVMHWMHCFENNFTTNIWWSKDCHNFLLVSCVSKSWCIYFVSVSARPSCGPEAPPCALHRTAISCPNQDCQTDCGSHPHCAFPICSGPVAVACWEHPGQHRLNRVGLPVQLSLGKQSFGGASFETFRCSFWKLPDMFDLVYRRGVLRGWGRLVGSRQENMYESSLSTC